MARFTRTAQPQAPEASKVDEDIQRARDEKAARAAKRGQGTQAPVSGNKEQLQKALDALAAAGVTGSALERAKRALVAEYVDKLEGVESLQREPDPDNKGYDIYTMTFRAARVQGMPEKGPQGGKPKLFGVKAHVRHAGHVFTLLTTCTAYETKGGTAPEILAEF